MQGGHRRVGCVVYYVNTHTRRTQMRSYKDTYKGTDRTAVHGPSLV